MSGAALLAVRGLRKRFGGVVATDDVTLEVAPGEIHALIGPNGAGKTSLIAQLSGSLMPDAGTIVFDGRDVTRLAQHERVRRGLARSFQITRLFRSFGRVASARRSCWSSTTSTRCSGSPTGCR